MNTFIPDFKDLQPNANIVPYFEDSAKNEISGRGTGKSIAALQKEVTAWLVKLGAFGVRFTPGQYPHGNTKRYGFRITFLLNGISGRMECAALPLRRESAATKDRALAQALYLLRDKLEAEYFAWVYAPNTIPLMPYLVGKNGKTVMEALVDSGEINLLPAGDS